MDYKKFYIQDEKEFRYYYERASQIFKMDKTFPSQVFKKGFTGFKFEEFLSAMSIDFWPTLRNLALNSGDEVVIVGVLDPKPVECYQKIFGYYNWIAIPTSVTDDDYYDVLEYGPDNSPADSIIDSSSILVWFSPSLHWGIMGDRDGDFCVIGFTDLETEVSLVPCLGTMQTLNEIVEGWISLSFRYPKDASLFIDELRKNYL